MSDSIVTNASVSPQRTLPEPFLTAWNIQTDAARVGFDWDHISGVVDKLREETDEIHAALAHDDLDEARAELGDILFTAVSLARFLSADPADELTKATQRFANRFARLQEEVQNERGAIPDYGIEELEVIWQRVKRLG